MIFGLVRFSFYSLIVIALSAEPRQPTFYRDVLPILQSHCQSCHREGQLTPMPLQTYRQVRPYAAAIKEATRTRMMPPWFADKRFGTFSNDPSLSSEQIQVLSSWSDNHAPAGEPRDAPPAPFWMQGWSIKQPECVLQMPVAKRLPASGDVSYQYIIIPTGFKEDRWVRMVEIRPSNRMVVHHAVAYVREPKSSWLRGAPVRIPFSADDLPTASQRKDAMWTTSDILLVYAPGSLPDQWPEGYAKLIPAGSDIVLQMHYTTRGASMQDQTSVGLVFAPKPPRKRVLTLQ